MQHPLASLWRHPTRVLFYQSSGLPEHSTFSLGSPGRPSAMGARRRFASAGDAFDYLRYWMGEPGARAELKSILQRSGTPLVGAHSGVDGWQHALARRMAAGAVVVVEENSQLGAPARLVAPTPAGAPDSAIAALPLPSDLSPATPSPVQESAANAASAVTAETSNAPPVTEAETSPATADQIAQAEVLEEAAKDGTPFCEICEAARKAAEQSAESTADQIAQAETLEQAASTGTPFCEICEKMRILRESSNE